MMEEPAGMSLTPRDVRRLFDQIAPLLADHPPPLQGAALADLLAMWLAGHIDETGKTETERLREKLLAAHLEAVRALLPVNDAIIRERRGKAR
jgi:hypothetical protein